MRPSCRACRTRVGTRTCPRSADTSKSPIAWPSRAAFSGEVVLRCSSLKAAICSGVAPGKKRDVKSCRNVGCTVPHPWRASVRTASAVWTSRGAARAPASHKPAVEHEPTHPLRVTHRMRNGHGAALRHPHQHVPLEPRRDERPPPGPGRTRPVEKYGTFTVREAVSARVVADEPPPVRQLRRHRRVGLSRVQLDEVQPVGGLYRAPAPPRSSPTRSGRRPRWCRTGSAARARPAARRSALVPRRAPVGSRAAGRWRTRPARGADPVVRRDSRATAGARGSARRPRGRDRRWPAARGRARAPPRRHGRAGRGAARRERLRPAFGGGNRRGRRGSGARRGAVPRAAPRTTPGSPARRGDSSPSSELPRKSPAASASASVRAPSGSGPVSRRTRIASTSISVASSCTASWLAASRQRPESDTTGLSRDRLQRSAPRGSSTPGQRS